MSYGLKYKFILQSANGAEVEIDVLQDGYTGYATQRALGNAPVLRQQKSGGVLGSSLAFSPECLIDGEFAQFYTTDAKEFMVELYRNNVKIWSGFIVPELYSEPDIAPPYDVDITAADGLGELRRYDFPAVGKVTLQALFVTLLGYTGQTLDINFISGLNYSGCSAAAFFLNTYIDLDYMAGKTCYEVLNYLLDTFHTQICYYAGRWLISRENDVTFDANGKPVYINASGQTSAYDGGKMAVTSMDDGPIWPVDFTSSSVDPALRSIVVEAPWNLYSGLVNSGMASDTGWTKSSNVSFVTGGGYRMLPDAYITQSITQLMGKPFLLTFDAATYIYHRNNVQQYSTAQVEVTFAEGNNTWYLVEDDSGALVWSSASKIVSYRIENAYGRANAIENQLSIPVFEDSNGDPVSGTLSIKFKAALNQGLFVYGAWLTVADEKGWKDILNINNGARGEADTVQIAVGYETAGINSYKGFYGGILLTSSDALVTSLSTGNFSNMDFLALISRDYARSIALPRLRTDGVINTPADLSEHPLILAYRGTNRWIETFDWDLLEDNFNFSALSLPSASLSVDSEVITATGSASGSADKTIGRLGPGGGEGQDGLTIMLSNYGRVFGAGSNGYAYSATDTVYVRAFKGSTAVATSIGTITGTVTGLSATKMNNNSTSASVIVSVGTTLNQEGSLVIPVTADGVTVNLRYSWSLSPKGDKGDPGNPGADGDNGDPGKSPRGPSDYSATTQYSGIDGTGDFIDYVYNADHSKMYVCIKTPPVGTPLTNTTYWQESAIQDFVATKIFYSQYGYVQNLGANAVKIANDQGVVSGGFMPPNTEGNGNTIFWAGGSTPSAAPFTIDNSGNIKANSGNIGPYSIDQTGGFTYPLTNGVAAQFHKNYISLNNDASSGLSQFSVDTSRTGTDPLILLNEDGRGAPAIALQAGFISGFRLKVRTGGGSNLGLAVTDNVVIFSNTSSRTITLPSPYDGFDGHVIVIVHTTSTSLTISASKPIVKVLSSGASEAYTAASGTVETMLMIYSADNDKWYLSYLKSS